MTPAQLRSKVTVQSHRCATLWSMGVTLEGVTAISRQVAAEQGGWTVEGVTFSDGGSDRVEILVALVGCHEGQCRFSINVTRSDGAEFERDFREKLGDAMQRHRAVVASQ